MVEENAPSEQPLRSNNSGSYNPGPPFTDGMPTEELSTVQAVQLDLAPEEFPEGPYGAATDEERLGKVSDWKPGQAFSGRYRDANLMRSDRRVALDEPKDSGGDNFDKQN